MDPSGSREDVTGPTPTLTDAETAPASPARDQPTAGPQKGRLPRRLLEGLRLVLRRSYSIVLALAAWEVASRIELVNPMFVPPFSEVVATWFEALFVSGSMWVHIYGSLYRAILGLIAAVIVGVVLGVLMGRLRAFGDFLDPLVGALFPMPKLALLPLLILWFGIGDASKIALIFLGAVFPVLINTYAGVRGVNKFLIWNALTKGANQRQIVLRVVLPAALPQMFAGFRVASSIAFLLIVASEMIAANEGLGHLIMYSQRTFSPDMMLAGVLTIAALGFVFDRMLNLASQRLLAWQDTAH